MFVEVAELVLSWDRAVWESVLYWRDHPGGYTVSRPAPSQHISLLGLKDWRTEGLGSSIIFEIIWKPSNTNEDLQCWNDVQRRLRWWFAIAFCLCTSTDRIPLLALIHLWYRTGGYSRLSSSSTLTTGRGNIIQFSSHFNMKEIYLVRPSFSNLPPAFPL